MCFVVAVFFCGTLDEGRFMRIIFSETVMNNGNLAPIRLITVGKSSNVNNMLEVIEFRSYLVNFEVQ